MMHILLIHIMIIILIKIILLQVIKVLLFHMILMETKYTMYTMKAMINIDIIVF